MKFRPAISRAMLLLLGMLVASVPLVSSAQDGTPPPGGFEIAPGVTAEAFAFAPGAESPALYRLTFAPGVTYQAQPAPEISLLYVEAGALSFTIDAPVSVTRADAADAPAEAIPAGTTFTVQAGDSMVFPLLAAAEVRNEGSDPASVMVASIMPSAMGPATPGASPAP